MSTRLSVSLAAVAGNYDRLCARAAGRVAAVVKADGYGLGAGPIAQHLAQLGCVEFFVATSDEGRQLRRVLPEPVIYILEGATAESVETLVEHELTPVLNSLSQCARWNPTRRGAALHIDTGMYRLGLAPDEAATLPNDLALTLVITHLACADEPDNPANASQVAQIQGLYQSLRRRFPNAGLSICNSGGLLAGLGPEDVGRGGIGLYGGNPHTAGANPMQPVACFEAQVLQIRDVPPGSHVGYGGTYTAPTGGVRLAVVGAGYADGVPRLLSGHGSVWLGGRQCPIVGRVSMDCTNVDIGDADVAEGDWAELLGTHIELDTVAALAQTIGYEILTGLGRRTSRTYLDGFLN
jgi:alanine racemase